VKIAETGGIHLNASQLLEVATKFSSIDIRRLNRKLTGK
jgi:hypothetical protein